MVNVALGPRDFCGFSSIANVIKLLSVECGTLDIGERGLWWLPSVVDCSHELAGILTHKIATVGSCFVFASQKKGTAHC